MGACLSHCLSPFRSKVLYAYGTTVRRPLTPPAAYDNNKSRNNHTALGKWHVMTDDYPQHLDLVQHILDQLRLLGVEVPQHGYTVRLLMSQLLNGSNYFIILEHSKDKLEIRAQLYQGTLYSQSNEIHLDACTVSVL